MNVIMKSVVLVLVLVGFASVSMSSCSVPDDMSGNAHVPEAHVFRIPSSSTVLFSSDHTRQKDDLSGHREVQERWNKDFLRHLE